MDLIAVVGAQIPRRKNLPRCFDGDLLHLWDSADRYFSGVALGNEVNHLSVPVDNQDAPAIKW